MKTFLLAVIIAAAPWTNVSAATTAKVEQGVLQGTKEDGLTVYRGIPFAAPPIGDLRWRPPQPAEKWVGVRPADKFAPECVQGGFGAPPTGGEKPAMSEDCLYLNVWTPARSPGWKFETPSPTDSTMPTASCPSTSGSLGNRHSPAARCRSV